MVGASPGFSGAPGTPGFTDVGVPQAENVSIDRNPLEGIVAGSPVGPEPSASDHPNVPPSPVPNPDLS